MDAVCVNRAPFAVGHQVHLNEKKVYSDEQDEAKDI